MDTNRRLLNDIRVDLHMWQANHYPPHQQWVYTFSLIFAFANGGVWMYLDITWWLQCTASFGGIILFLCLFKRLFDSKPRTWPDALDRKLARYKPLDLAAWRELQATVVENRGLTPEVVERWYDKEKTSQVERLSGKSPVTGRFQFLHNHPDSNPGKERNQ